MRHIILRTPRFHSGHGWKSWNPTSWTHSPTLQFSGFPAYLLSCWHSLHGSFCRAALGWLPLRGPAWSTDPLSRPCAVWGCVGVVWGSVELCGVVWGMGSRPQQAKWNSIYFPCWRQAAVTWVKVQQQQPLYSIHTSSWEAVESLSARPWSSNTSCSQGWHSASYRTL